LPIRDTSPRVIYTKLAVGEDVSGPPPRAKFHYSGFGQIVKILNIFVINLPLRGQSPYGFLQNLASERDSQVRSLMPNFTVVALKVGLTAAKIAKIGNFSYKFSPKGYVPFSDFYKIWRGGGSPRSPQSRQLLPLSH